MTTMPIDPQGADDMAISPEIRGYLSDLARRLDSAPFGGTGTILDEAAGFLGWSRQTVYRNLKTATGWSSGRKCRADKGTTSVASEALATLAAAQRESIRDNGKQTLFTTTGRGVMQANGIDLGVSTSQLNRLMRDRRMDVKAQRHAAPVQHLRAPYPNHTHEVDPSLCLVYYLHDRQYIMRDREFYKNKLENYARVKFKVFRYVLYDRASGLLVPWYCEAMGEDQHHLFEFLMYAWGQRDGRAFHGVPRCLLWDKGSANQSGAIKNLLTSLGVTPLDHQAGNARAKGGVEGGNNIVETQFESRLRFEPVADVAQLNAAALAWANAFNANRLPGQDTRLRRSGIAPIARYDLWQRITAEQLRLLPPVDVCRALMASAAEQRVVRPDLSIQYRHPGAKASALYSLLGLDGINVGDRVEVRALVYGHDAIQIQAPRYDGDMLTYRVEPETGFDAFGQQLDAAEIGSEYKQSPHTDAQRAAGAMDELAYPNEDAKAARDRKVTPFDGRIAAHSYLHDVEMPTYLPRRGTDIATPEHAQAAAAPQIVDAVTAMLRIVDGIKRHLTTEEHAFLAQRYAAGVPEDQIDALIEQFLHPHQPAPIQAAGGLRAV